MLAALMKRDAAGALAPPPAPTLEQLLEALTHAGRPRVHQFDDGTWGCTVKMHVAAAGTTFEIRSDYTHASPLEAAKQCVDRVRATLAQFGGRT